MRADAGGATPSDFAIIYRGVDWIRVGASVPVQVLRTDAWDVDITAQARLRLEPPDRGEITPDGSFHALGLGRVAIIAEVGGRQETGIIEVSNELPVGTPMLPMIRANNGLVPVHLGLDRAPDGRISMDFGFINHWLVVSGRPLGRTFPMTVPIVRTTPGVRFDPHRGPEAVLPVTGTLVFDRWRLRRLDGHLTARAGTLSLQVTFSMLLADPQTLTAPPATEPVAGQRLTP